MRRARGQGTGATGRPGGNRRQKGVDERALAVEDAGPLETMGDVGGVGGRADLEVAQDVLAADRLDAGLGGLLVPRSGDDFCVITREG